MSRSDSSYVIMVQTYPQSPVSDAYRTLRINIEFAAAGSELKTIAITSANRAEGKTTTLLNLAAAYAQVGRKVLLIDADLRKPAVHLAFRMDNGIGLTNVLGGQNTADEAVRPTDIPGLSVLPSGQKPFNASELLASQAYDSLLQEFKQLYDIILIDTPPVLSVMDAKIIAAKSDGVLLVAEHRKLKRDEAIRLKDELAAVNARILGVAFNKINGKDMEMYPY